VIFLVQFRNQNQINQFRNVAATLLTIEQLGLSEKSAIVVVGLAFAAAGVYSGVIFAILGPLSRR
jgi:ceroid-lipofuscinosis MFS transporter 7